MIDKETLLKKIENEETVWLIGADVIEWKLKKGDYVNGGYRRGAIFQPFDGIFVTKEESEWKLEFGNITRTVKLELPSWTEIKKWKVCKFHTINNNRVCFYKKIKNMDVKDCWLAVEYNSKTQTFPSNYNGYIKACRLCKKLFLDGAE